MIYRECWFTKYSAYGMISYMTVATEYMITLQLTSFTNSMGSGKQKKHWGQYVFYSKSCTNPQLGSVTIDSDTASLASPQRKAVWPAKLTVIDS